MDSNYVVAKKCLIELFHLNLGSLGSKSWFQRFQTTLIKERNSSYSEEIANSFLHEPKLEFSFGFLRGFLGVQRVPEGSRGPQTSKSRDFEFHGVPEFRINRKIKEVPVVSSTFAINRGRTSAAII